MKVAILGAEGFLGSELYGCFKSHYDVHGVTRTNYNSKSGESFDIFINANGNSRRYWANHNILEDFEASVYSVYQTFFDFKIGCYIYISSADVYSKHEDLLETDEEEEINPKSLCPYGFHKYLSELIVKKYVKKYLILRCSAMIGENIRKGPIKDIVDDKPLFITLDSRLQFISTSEIAKVISKLISNNIYNEIFNVGGVSTVSLDYLGTMLHKALIVRQGAERQIYEMKVTKLKKIFPIKKSEEYIQEYFVKSKIGRSKNERVDKCI